MSDALQVDVPVPGYYQVRLVKGGPWVACRIWHGTAIIDGEPQDRSVGWFVEIDGETDTIEKDDAGYRCRVPLQVDKVWPYCADSQITEPEFQFLKARAAHARKHNPSHPAANPYKPVDLGALKPRF